MSTQFLKYWKMGYMISQKVKGCTAGYVYLSRKKSAAPDSERITTE